MILHIILAPCGIGSLTNFDSRLRLFSRLGMSILLEEDGFIDADVDVVVP
jgi:hypothetical protein